MGGHREASCSNQTGMGLPLHVRLAVHGLTNLDAASDRALVERPHRQQHACVPASLLQESAGESKLRRSSNGVAGGEPQERLTTRTERTQLKIERATTTEEIIPCEGETNPQIRRRKAASNQRRAIVRNLRGGGDALTQAQNRKSRSSRAASDRNKKKRRSCRGRWKAEDEPVCLQLHATLPPPRANDRKRRDNQPATSSRPHRRTTPTPIACRTEDSR